MMRVFLTVSRAAVGALIAIMFAAPVVCRAEDLFDTAPINYSSAEVTDPVARLQKRLDGKTARLEFDERFGYLPAVLKQLGVPAASQMLVFSKTSFQQRRISPHRPRAVYFNDDVYVGWVQSGSVLELSSVDPQLGAVFYSIGQRESGNPTFVRQTHECLQCHTSSLTQGIPGHLVRSVYPDSDGFPLLRAGTFRTDHSSPFQQRWGGWYVTGTHGALRHMGNVIAEDEEQPDRLDVEKGANLTSLEGLVDTESYFADSSDIVALMVLEHQTQMHNLITRANYETRRALYDLDVMNRVLERPADYVSESASRRIATAGERLLKYLLFHDEFQLTDAIAGTSDFAKQFTAAGPADEHGRSLRDFDLQRRLFKYPCSYLIYSEAFTGLPPQVKQHLYGRLWEVLDGKDESGNFAHLSAGDRQAIREILLATKPDLKEIWTSAGFLAGN